MKKAKASCQQHQSKTVNTTVPKKEDKEKNKNNITEKFLKQSEDYGRRPNENIGRVGIYTNKVANIYKNLGQKEMDIKIMANGKEIGFRKCLELHEAVSVTREVGTLYFLDIFYTNSWDTVKLVIRGEAPRKEGIKER